MSDFVDPTPEMFAEFRRHFVEGHPDECWPWLGKMRGKYGKFYWRKKKGKGRSVHASRAHLMLREGKVFPSNIHVCHTCDNPPCVNPKHLFKCTHIENMDDRDAKGRQSKGSALPQSKITEDMVSKVLAEEGVARVVAEKLGVSARTIRAIRKGNAWKHVNRPTEVDRPKAGGARYLVNPAAKLTEDDVRNIRQSGDSNEVLGQRYGVEREQIRRIKKRERWAHIPD